MRCSRRCGSRPVGPVRSPSSPAPVVQLAAAGVKTRQGRRKGATRLAGAAHGRLVTVAATTPHVLGSAVAEWVAFAEAVQARCETGAADPDLAVECLFGSAPW